MPKSTTLDDLGPWRVIMHSARGNP